MRVGHVASLPWPAATRSRAPNGASLRAFLQTDAFTYRIQGHHQLPTSHGPSSPPYAARAASYTICHSSPNPYNQFGNKRTLARRYAFRLQQGRLATQDIGTKQELEFLESMARTVTKRVCGTMKFQTAQETLSVIAEAMLRVPQFRSSSIVLDGFDLDSEDSASQAPRKTSAIWKTSTVGTRHEIEITKRDEASDQDQGNDKLANDELATDEDHENHGDEIVAAADDAVDAPQAFPAATGAPSEEDDDPVMQPDHDSAVVPADSADDGELKTSDFVENIIPHLNARLHENPLVRSGERLKFLVCQPFRSRRVETNLGFDRIGFKLTWPSEQWPSAAQHSMLDLARIVEVHMSTKVAKNLKSCGEAVRELEEILPGSPKVKLMLEMRSPQWPLEHQTFRLTLFSQNGENRFTIALPRVKIHQFSPNLVNGEACELLHLSLSMEGVPIPATVSDVTVVNFLEMLMDALEAKVVPIVQDHGQKGLEYAAQRIASRVLDVTKQHPDALHPSQVEVALTRRTGDSERSGVRFILDSEEAIFVALGSNVGDRIANIEEALQSIDENSEIQLLRTSPLYETEPMYVEDQEKFLNGVCKIATQLAPIELLDQLQAIEHDLGRVKLIEKGPRNIDLDIVTYRQRIIHSDRLMVPHPLMLEREFVLRPLCDLAESYIHPQSRKPVIVHLSELGTSGAPMYPSTPLAPGLALQALNPVRKTMVMSILNVTLDSFSDGGIHQPANVEALKATVSAHIAAGARIIDIGGQSSRPNAPDISAEEEIARIRPAIEAIRSLPEAEQVAISIDTYRAAVAEAAVNAGAHIINDISAGLLDPEMLPTIARLGCTYIMMHMRGTPATMQNEENTSYPHGLIPTIQSELRQRLQAAEQAGIRRWRIILDPGIGFAKTAEQNLEILRKFSNLRLGTGLNTYPWLVGSSRKGFIGKITGVENAADRISGTAATVTAAVQGGAEIVRVHDVVEMAQVVKMADAMYRVPRS